MFVEATKLGRSPLQAYRDYASRNWPMWWSLKLGMPLGYSLAIVVLTSIIGLTADVSDLKIVDHQLLVEYGRCTRNCGGSPEESSRCRNNCLPDVRDRFIPIIERAQSLIASLIAFPLVVGTLFSFLWFFYTARSLKFTNAPLLGRQPGILPLVLLGCGLLCAGLVGFKLFQWRSYSIGLLDFATFGSILPSDTHTPIDTIDDYRGYNSVFRGEGAALVGLMLCSTLVSYGAVFLVLHRQMGIGAALSGLVFKILVLGLSAVVIAAMSSQIESSFWGGLLIVAPLLAVPLIGLYTLSSGHRVRGLSTLGISTLLYLVSVGPMWLGLTIGLSQIPSALAFLQDKQILFYFLCLGASLVACEVLVSLEYRNRLRPA
jgi:hypothetical protein